MNDLTLPKTFVFLDGHTQLGNNLEGRDLFMHLQTKTIFEAIPEGEDVYINPKYPRIVFEFMNTLSIPEIYTVVIHSSDAEDLYIPKLLEQAKYFWIGYCNWEDRNIHDQDIGKMN